MVDDIASEAEAEPASPPGLVSELDIAMGWQLKGVAWLLALSPEVASWLSVWTLEFVDEAAMPG